MALVFEVEGSFKMLQWVNPALFQGASLGTTWMDLAKALWGPLGLHALSAGQLAVFILQSSNTVPPPQTWSLPSAGSAPAQQWLL